jgi:transposase
MERMRSKHSPTFKAKVALEAIKEQQTSAELAGKYQVHPVQIRTWKSEAMKGLAMIFTDKRKRVEKEKDELIEELYRQIGQLKVEGDWLKKKLGT